MHNETSTHSRGGSHAHPSDLREASTRGTPSWRAEGSSGSWNSRFGTASGARRLQIVAPHPQVAGGDPPVHGGGRDGSGPGRRVSQHRQRGQCGRDRGDDRGSSPSGQCQRGLSGQDQTVRRGGGGPDWIPAQRWRLGLCTHRQCNRVGWKGDRGVAAWQELRGLRGGRPHATQNRCHGAFGARRRGRLRPGVTGSVARPSSPWHETRLMPVYWSRAGVLHALLMPSRVGRRYADGRGATASRDIGAVRVFDRPF